MQKDINFYQAIGNAGDVVKASHSYLLTEDYIAGSDCQVGTFVQRGDKEKEVKQATGTQVTGEILGVCLKTNFINSEVTTNAYKAGSNVFILNRGQVYMNFTGATKNGQFIFLKTDDGSLVLNDTSILANHTYTGFRIVAGGNPSATGLNTCVIQDYTL